MSLVQNSTQVHYPSSDGRPMAENTLQFEWIVAIKGSLDRMFQHDPDVFVAGDLLWYPVEGDNKLNCAPDALVAFGRPKGHRSSYMQWLEEGIAPQVVFEVLSPGNRHAEMLKKFQFYDRFGVEEYYVIDPDNCHVDGWLRKDGELIEIEDMLAWVSPRLGIRFEVEEQKLVRLWQPDGTPFLTYLEVCEQMQQARQAAEHEAARAEIESNRANQETLRAEHESLRAEHESLRAEQESLRAEQETARANEEATRAAQQTARADRLADLLRELGVDPDQL